MREANDRGYDSLLVEEATASYFPAFKAATIEMIVAQGGIVGWAAPLQAVLDGVKGRMPSTAVPSEVRT
jgi:nicotinamidase-related amidase